MFVDLTSDNHDIQKTVILEYKRRKHKGKKKIKYICCMSQNNKQ